MTSSHDNSLDDIFGSSPPHERERIPHESSVGVPEPSDLPSLRRQHVTAGYRDGISTSKGQHVQNGFDAGFPVGAQLGMRVGTILGIIEGVLRGYEGGASSGVVKKLPQRGAAGASSSNSQETEEARRAKHEQLLKLYQRAVKELDVQAVFAGLGDTLGDGQSGEEKPEIQLRRKGNLVVSEWEKKVNVALWEENMEALEAKNEDGHEQDEPMTA